MISTMTIKEAAGVLRVQPRTIRIWISKGKIHAYRAGRSYLLDRPDVERLLARVVPARTQESVKNASRLAEFKSAFRGYPVDKDAVRADRLRELKLEESTGRACQQ